ncbi:aldo/keto reductase [Nonomuraea rubra]|uniref:aldo/keto reductase n=1 Tax=Nonomuraea rubra TaxID=46180 RepID=UPI0033F0CB96
MEPAAERVLSGKYRRGAQVADSARSSFVGSPSQEEFTVIDAVAEVADEVGATSAAVALAWLRARQGTVVPIVGARRVTHLQDNLTALEVTLTPEHLRMLDEVSAPDLNYPAPLNGEVRRMLQFAGATVDGEPSTVYPPLTRSTVRY